MRLPLPLVALAALTAAASDWPHYGGSPDQMRYSPLAEITRENVSTLKVAWTYDTGDAFPGSEMQCQPVVAHGVLYATSPKLRVFALDAATGREIWRHGWPCELKPLRGDLGGPAATPAIDGDRVYAVGHEGRLVCLDAATGKPDWSVDLRKDLGTEPSRRSMRPSRPKPGSSLPVRASSA